MFDLYLFPITDINTDITDITDINMSDLYLFQIGRYKSDIRKTYFMRQSSLIIAVNSTHKQTYLKNHTLL